MPASAEFLWPVVVGRLCFRVFIFFICLFDLDVGLCRTVSDDKKGPGMMKG